jgi:hypothetical protein
VVAVGEDQACPQLRVILELTVGGGQLLKQLEVSRIPLLRAVESDEQQVSVPFDGDS